MAIRVRCETELLDEKVSETYDACCTWVTESKLEKCHRTKTDEYTGSVVLEEHYYAVTSWTTHFNGVETFNRLDEEFFDSLPEAEACFNRR
jgi:hypothetical protein